MDIVAVGVTGLRSRHSVLRGGERIRDLGAIEAFVSQTNAPTMGA
jgi:hypothetical protein